MHETDTHDSKLSFKDIINGFEVDEEFFKILIETMYEGEEKDIPSVNVELIWRRHFENTQIKIV